MSDKYTLVILNQDGCPPVGGNTSVYFNDGFGRQEFAGIASAVLFSGDALEQIEDQQVTIDKLVDELQRAMSEGLFPYKSERRIVDLINSVTEKKCEHNKGLTDYCEPCGRIHSE